jgi:hypothetical protein
MNDDGSQRLKIRLPEADWQRLLAAESVTEASLDSSRPVSMREEFC